MFRLVSLDVRPIILRGSESGGRELYALWCVGASRAGASRAWRSRPRISGSTLATFRLGAAPRRETFGRVSKESRGKLNLWNPPDALSEPSSIWNINFDSARPRRDSFSVRDITGVSPLIINVIGRFARSTRRSRMHHFGEFNFTKMSFRANR